MKNKGGIPIGGIGQVPIGGFFGLISNGGCVGHIGTGGCFRGIIPTTFAGNIPITFNGWISTGG